MVWFDDATPAGANLMVDMGDAWTWVSSNPAPYSGSKAHQSVLKEGLHQHYFLDATDKLNVSAGDKLFAYVYLDPANPPRQVMLQWHEATGNMSGWDHRAYWGANEIVFGMDGTDSKRPMGKLPATGRWVRLEVPANLVGLEGMTIDGMAFTLFDGAATWDKAGIVFARPRLVPEGVRR
jgi:hypothetical protein